ncbi:hypothetical protein BV25DRAFT_1818781 [Artomyces pyxidatus]|uniref:Uncharacterized protein n=1 Tax=Artomyces pyxidatus TaxID=48021 RepID=A0ACB8TIU1_9AGAM|nr:hypothetical protein BV25DRAFT_1818781 [Artomyces pyxidatus]
MDPPLVPLASSSQGRQSGKPWKLAKAPSVSVPFSPLPCPLSPSRSRSHLQDAVKAKSWADRMEKTKKQHAINKLQAELKDEKQAEIQRCVCCLPSRSNPSSAHPDDATSRSSARRPPRSASAQKSSRHRCDPRHSSHLLCVTPDIF